MKARNLPVRAFLVILAVSCTLALAADNGGQQSRSAAGSSITQAAPQQRVTPGARPALPADAVDRFFSVSAGPQVSPVQASPPRASGETYVRYPGNWAEVVRRQERYGALQRMEDKPTREARRRFNATVPEIAFETGTALADAIDRIRRDSGMNIFVNWPALQQYGITREQEVDLPRMAGITWRKVTELILQQVTASLGGVTQLDWGLEDGVLTISTREDLSANLTARVYDIGDLLMPRKVVQQGTGFNLTGQAGGAAGSGTGTGTSSGTTGGSTGGFGG
jgi:hypothetical protein